MFDRVVKWTIVQHAQGNSAHYGNSVMIELFNQCLRELVLYVSVSRERGSLIFVVCEEAIRVCMMRSGVDDYGSMMSWVC